MFLTEKHSSYFSFFFPQIPKNPPPNPFEQTLIARLNSLPPFPESPSSIPLSYLSQFIDLLTLTLTDLTAVISSPSISVTDHPSLSSHLNSSISLLESCNAISATADRILHRSLLLRLAFRLISSSKLPRARSAIAEWRAADHSPSDLRQLRSNGPNGARKASAVRRAIYAVEVISDLVVGLALAFLGGRGGLLVGVLVSGDFVWGAAYNEVAARVLGVCCGEIEGVERSVEKLGVAVEGDAGGGGGAGEGLRDAARGAEEAVEELAEGMDGLGKAVGALFRSGLESREAALRCFRVWDGRCD